jgi:hypothetical protein
MALIAQRLTPEQYVVTSFLPRVLAQVKADRPGTRTGLLVGPGSARHAARRMREAGADFLAPHVTLVHAGILEWAARRSLSAWVWTVNDARSLAALSRDPRVAALITDTPQLALAASHPVDLPDSRE